MKIKIFLALAILSVMVVTVTVMHAANNLVVIDDFESYTTGQSLDGQGGWVAPGCNITVENVTGNNILRANSCSNGQEAVRPFTFPFTDQVVYSYVRFKGRITNGGGGNSNSIVRLISPNENIDFGMVYNPSLGIDHQVRFFNSALGAIYGPKLPPGTWYDFRLEIDWSYTSSSGGFGLATLSYKEVTEANWLTPATFSNLELNVIDPTQFNEMRARIDGLSNRRGEMDDITYLVLQPEMDVQGNGQSINNGDKTPSLADGTDFGTTQLGTPIIKTYTISNSGSFTLTLMSPVTVPNGFSASNFGTTQVPPNSTTTVAIQLDASTPGTFTGSVQIASNDLDKTPYTFVVKGIVPASSSTTYFVYLPTVLRDYAPPSTFPVQIGDAISRRDVGDRGEVFYRTTVEVPANLPAGGHFYLSSKPDSVTETLVDDEVAILLDRNELLTYNFSANGSPKPAAIEIPRSTIEQMAGKGILVEYRDLYGYVVEARVMWLIWSP